MGSGRARRGAGSGDRRHAGRGAAQRRWWRWRIRWWLPRWWRIGRRLPGRSSVRWRLSRGTTGALARWVEQRLEQWLARRLERRHLGRSVATVGSCLAARLVNVAAVGVAGAGAWAGIHGGAGARAPGAGAPVFPSWSRSRFPAPGFFRPVRRPSLSAMSKSSTRRPRLLPPLRRSSGGTGATAHAAITRM